MSFCVAVQSAIFYLAACTPCRQARHHQKSIARAKEERKEKERLKAEHPDTYQHPDPFNTNPYWSEEIMMGPHIEARKYNSSKNVANRGLNSAGNENPSVAGSTVAVETPNPHPSSTPTVVAEDGTLSLTTSISEDWNKKRYQREDEELWGHEFSRAGHRLMDAIKHAGSSAHRRIEASLGMEPKHITDEERQQFYFAPKNPPVNDYHPPIVRQLPAHRDAHKWMLQPPPAAKIMEGKVPVSRSGSMVSHLSRRTTTSDSPALGRLVHEKAMQAKLRSGELPNEHENTSSLSWPDSKRTRRNTASSHQRQSLQSVRSRSLSVESSDASGDLARRRMKRRTRPPMSPEDESSEDDDEFYQLKTADPGSKSAKAARRPKLQTITSSRGSEQDSKGEAASAASEDPQTPRTSTAPFDDILNVLPAPPPPTVTVDNPTMSTTGAAASPASPVAAPLATRISI